MKTVTLISAREDVNNLVIRNVSTYRVGYKLIWIEYNDGESIIAVKRRDYKEMHVNEHTDIAINGDDFERINCEHYEN